PAVQRFTDTTLRQVVRLSTGGDRLRVRLTNVYGDAALAVGRVTVAVRAAGLRGTPALGGTPVDVTFAGARATSVPAGAEWVSDPVRLAAPAGADLVVSIHLPGPTPRPSVHYEAVSTTWSAPGDATGDRGAAFAPVSTPLATTRYFLDGIDVSGRAPGSVVFLGDSITDGVKSVVDADQRYPDVVARRVLRLPEQRRFGVLNAGLSANRLLDDAGLGGESVLARFERDVLGQTGVRTVVLLEGINDIHGSYGAVDANALIGVYRQLVQRAHDAGVRVVGGTLLPFEGAPKYTADGEADRQAVNAWIRTSGVFDAVVDFDAALRDPAHPTRLLPRYDTGDHVHPDDAGYAAMADAVDLGDL
ncbi:SGNH/GDSL hydrolase family protein, partial [Kineococcus glutinatus]|uniref:SGNH/GDSL hydrolase family protein n=1 Tax=Kineococcus glutinatus TaxID=1070872 RepID=UPI0031EA0526